MYQHTQNTRLALGTVFTWALAFMMLSGLANASTVNYFNVLQDRDPIGPPSVPDFSLPNQILLPTPAYGTQHDGISPLDEGRSTFNFRFDTDVDNGRVAHTVGLRQRLAFEINDPDLLEDNFVAAETEVTISFTEINGVPIPPEDVAPQQVFTLGTLLQNGDILPGGAIETLVPLDFPGTAFTVSLDNTLTAFSVSGNAFIAGADLQFITLTEVAIPEPSTAGLLGIAAIAAGFRCRLRSTSPRCAEPWLRVHQHMKCWSRFFS